MDWQTLIGWKREKRKEERGKRKDPVLHLLTYTVFRFCFCDCTYASVSNRILVPVCILSVLRTLRTVLEKWDGVLSVSL